MANLIVAAGADRLVGIDFHQHQIQGFFDIPVDHLYAAPVLVSYFRDKGFDDLVVVETDDAIMVAAKDRVQDVKQISERLTALKRPESEAHRKVYRPWGWYDCIDTGLRHKAKRIAVNPGAKLSLQMHYHRAEHWVVIKGTAKITLENREIILTEDQSTYIPLETKHRLENIGKIPLEIIEVQTGSYLGEDDIVRFSDDYGRDA